MNCKQNETTMKIQASYQNGRVELWVETKPTSFTILTEWTQYGVEFINGEAVDLDGDLDPRELTQDEINLIINNQDVIREVYQLESERYNEYEERHEQLYGGQ